MPKNCGDDSDDEYTEYDNNSDTEQEYENEYYLYEEITEKSCMKLLKYLRERKKEWDKVIRQLDHVILKATPKPIKIYINSSGGDLHAMLPVVDYIKDMRKSLTIHTYVEGVAASAASLLAVVGHKRFCTKNSFLLIHELRSYVTGTFSNIQDEKYNCEKLMTHLKEIYISNSNNLLTTEKLEKLLKQDLLLSADECVELGLIDIIIG